MLFTLSVHHGPSYLLVVGSGPASVAEMCAIAPFLAELVRRGGYRRALLDVLSVTPSLSADDHLELGRYTAQCLGHLDRMATVVPAAQRVGVSERAAQDGGLRLRTFTQLEAATAWLNAAD